MKISIITVCYNSERTIERAIKSVIAQQYNDLEYIIIDGDSTDSTCEVIRKYDKKITYWLSEPDAGIYDAMNKGIAVSSGDVVAFLNSDDWYENNTFSLIAEYFGENDVDMVSGSVCCVKNGQNSMIHSKKQDNVDGYFFNIEFPHPALFVKTDLFKKHGVFNYNYKIAADYDWMLRMCLAGANVLTVNDCFTFFSYGGVSTLRRYDALREQYKIALCAMKYYKKEYLEEKLREHYERELYFAKREKYYHWALQHNVSAIKMLLDTGKRYYIWGVGERGKQCKDLFVHVNIDIVGFIDSYADVSEYEGYCVLRPADIESNMVVCVTPKQYENEIMIQLREMGVGEDNILLFSNLVEMIIQIGKSEDNDDYGHYNLL